ncbi:MAG: dihydroorotase [Rhodospirillaceae bacterium]|jgi:dihydroorotase|nr:dihydroorotase [Rhodospirillaceae bacterium]MBT5013944.1 dihydroorotase [Rhodospirillaceae bacterium]
MSKTAYINARLLDPATGLDTSGTLVTDGESIADFGEKVKAPKGAKTIDCQGKCLMPGLVDMRVQLREPGEEYKGTLESAGRAATEGGVTTMVCLPNTTPVIDDISVLEFVARRARKLGLAKVYPYGAVTKGLAGEELAEMGMLAEAGALAFTDGIHAISDARMMSRALSYAANFGLIIVQHAEEPSLAAGGCMTGGETATRLGLSGIPAAAEVIMVERDIRLVRMTGGRLHFAHVSTSDAIDTIRAAKAEGLAITCDTAPPYFALNETAIGDYRTFAKLSPPLRTEADREAVIAGLKDGTIDAIASDHAPHDEESKRVPFAQAASGGVGLETLLSVTLELYHNGHLGLLDALKLVTSAPADLFGLTAGRLQKGDPADLVLIDPDSAWKIDADHMVSISKNTPFDGRPVQGRTLMTIVDGRPVFKSD